MLSTTARRNLKVLPVVLVLSILLIATTALAATKLMKAKSGGVVNIAVGIRLKVEKGSLEEDTYISAELTSDGGRVGFEFGPAGTVFSEPAKLRISQKAVEEMGLEGLTLYGDRGQKIEPDVNPGYVEYEIPHFSIYYYRRR